MAWKSEQLEQVFERTRGRCHLCAKTLARSNYGLSGRRGAWEVDHSRARARGGSDHLNNLRAACIPCNRSKRDGSNGPVRKRHGRSRAPMAPSEYERAKRDAGVSWGLGGMLVAGLLGLAPGGVVLVGAVTGAMAYNGDPED